MIQLSNEAQDRIEVKRTDFEKGYWNDRKEIDGSGLSHLSWQQSVESFAIDFLPAVFFAHAAEFLRSEAAPAEIRQSAESELSTLADELLASDKWPISAPLPENSPFSLQELREVAKRQVINDIKRHADWQEFQSELAALSTRLPSNVASRKAAASWEDIEITFTSDERVQIHIGKSTETRNYAEMGFADDRDGKPSKAWVTLRNLALERGVLRRSTTVDPWPKVEKRIQEIRKKLQNRFDISANPISFRAQAIRLASRSAVVLHSTPRRIFANAKPNPSNLFLFILQRPRRVFAENCCARTNFRPVGYEQFTIARTRELS